MIVKLYNNHDSTCNIEYCDYLVIVDNMIVGYQDSQPTFSEELTNLRIDVEETTN